MEALGGPKRLYCRNPAIRYTSFLSSQYVVMDFLERIAIHSLLHSQIVCHPFIESCSFLLSKPANEV